MCRQAPRYWIRGSAGTANRGIPMAQSIRREYVAKDRTRWIWWVADHIIRGDIHQREKVNLGRNLCLEREGEVFRIPWNTLRTPTDDELEQEIQKLSTRPPHVRRGGERER